MKLLGLLFLLLASSAFAATKEISLDMKTSINGKAMSSQHMIVQDGKSAGYSQVNGKETEFVDFVATEKVINGRHGILMNMTVGTVDKDGQKKIAGKPQVFAYDNQPAHMSVRNNDDTQDLFAMSITAKTVTTK